MTSLMDLVMDCKSCRSIMRFSGQTHTVGADCHPVMECKECHAKSLVESTDWRPILCRYTQLKSSDPIYAELAALMLVNTPQSVASFVARMQMIENLDRGRTFPFPTVRRLPLTHSDTKIAWEAIAQGSLISALQHVIADHHEFDTQPSKEMRTKALQELQRWSQHDNT